MNSRKTLHLVTLAAAAVLLAGTTAHAQGAGKASKMEDLPARNGKWSAEDTARGRAQLVRALDAAWIRVIGSGQYRDILRSEPASKPGAAQDYIVRLVDCLPDAEVAPWPEKPVGMFKDILDTGMIRQLVQGVPETPANTSWYFSGVSEKMQAAVFAEIEKHYGVTLRVENVVLPPGRLPITSLLVDNKVDFISQLNATGGITQGLRRRMSRRFSCTMSASSQFIHIPEKSPLVGKINNLGDLIERPDVKICAGPLTTQTAAAFMPNNVVKTKFINDLTACDTDVKAGKLDVIMNPLNDLSIAGIKGYVAVPTMMVAGTPLWVALEDIACPSDGDPRTEDECHETSGPW